MRVLNVFQTPLVALDVGTSITRAQFAVGSVAERPSVVREGGVRRRTSRPTSATR